ncbi:unnamed protein product [Prunus armeniaca]
MALGTPEHGGRVRGVGAGVSPTQFFNLPRQQRVKFDDKLKESVMAAVREETKKMEARAKESVMEAVRVEREIMLKQFSQLIPNFDPNMLSKIPTTPTTPITPIPPIPQEQSPKNPMSDKASCSNVRAPELDEDNPMNDANADAAENRQDQTDLSKLDMPAPLLALCQYVETKLKPANETITVHMPEEMFGTDHDTRLLSEDILQFASMVAIRATVIAVYMRYLFDYLKMANMVKLVGLVDPGQVSSQSGTLSHCSKHLSESLKKADGDQFYLVPYNPGGHWVLKIVRLAKVTVYYMNSLPNRSVDEDMRNIVNTLGIFSELSFKALGIFSELSQTFDIFSQLSLNIHGSLKWNGDGRIRLWFFVDHNNVCEMDKSWMHADRRSKAYELGVEGFLNFAVENLLNTTHIPCPCVKCGNIRLFGVGIIRDHFYFNGIDQSYKIWTWHGEPLEWTTNASRNVEEDEQCGFSFVSEEVGMDDNDLGDIGFDPYEFANVIGDGDRPLYPGSSKYTMLLALNRTRSEGCIAERYIAKEAVEFCTEHLSEVNTVGVSSSQKMGVSKPLSGCTVSLVDRDLLNQAHLYVLENTEEVLPYIEEHMIHIKTTYPKFRKRTKWLQDKHNSTFIQWLHFKVQSELNGEENNDVSKNLRWLAAGLSMAVPSYRSYLINGIKFNTKAQDDVRTIQNSGVYLLAHTMQVASAKDKNLIVSNMGFYGLIQEIWDLGYQKFRISILRCDWIDNTSGLVVDELGFTLVDLSKIGHRNAQFVMASQVK